MSDGTRRIDICICTFQRPYVVNTLASVAALLPVDGFSIHVIVADNDESPSAQVLVREAAEQFGLTLTYVHAPARNISIARNACLNAATADYMAFIDDDEMVTPEWLQAMMATMAAEEPAAVLGPVKAVYDKNAPEWMQAGDYHSTKPVWVRGLIVTGYAGNVLMDRRQPALQGLRFDEALGVTGGEDTDFFGRLHQAGGRIAYADAALAYEPVPPTRATFAWLRARRYRYGQTHAQTLLKAGKNRVVALVKVSLKILVCSFMTLFHLGFTRKAIAWRLRGTMHWAVLITLLRGHA